MRVRGSANSSVGSLRIQGLILSGPVVFAGFSCLSSLWTLGSVMLMRGILAANFLCGGMLFKSESRVNTEWDWRTGRSGALLGCCDLLTNTWGLIFPITFQQIRCQITAQAQQGGPLQLHRRILFQIPGDLMVIRQISWVCNCRSELGHSEVAVLCNGGVIKLTY